MINSSATTLDIVSKNHLNVLIQLAYADKHFAPLEREMIYKVGREKNFPADKIERLIQNPEPVGTLGALSAAQKLNYLLDCIELAFIDEQVPESELNFCRGIAIKMGLKKNVIDFLVEHHSLNREELRATVASQYMA
jgi:uncharacterized tellurite resistance protein B-like protein